MLQIWRTDRICAGAALPVGSKSGNGHDVPTLRIGQLQSIRGKGADQVDMRQPGDRKSIGCLHVNRHFVVARLQIHDIREAKIGRDNLINCALLLERNGNVCSTVEVKEIRRRIINEVGSLVVGEA